VSTRRLAAAGALVAVVPLLVGVASPAALSPGKPPATAKARAIVSHAAASQTETISRTHLVAGADQVADTRTVTVGVSQTTELRDRQEIAVSWTGAHPTGGLVADINSAAAASQEYPVVLLECRGVSSTSVPLSQQIRPETCWTATSDERYQVDNTFNFPPWRVDRYAPASERVMSVDQPATIPPACGSAGGGASHWVHFVAVSGKDYPGGPFGCGGIPPEAVQVEGQFQPSNTTYGISDSTGSGSATFLLQSAETNASMGCSDTVACSLVVIPIMGTSCDTDAAGLPPQDQPGPDGSAAAFAGCSSTGKYLPGAPGTGANQEAVAVSGLLWWSASNWRGRLAFPLHFAQPSNVCSVLNTSAPTFVYGSELATQATLQWAPTFCLSSKLFKFQHVQTSDPEAKNLLNGGSIGAAFQAEPPAVPFERPIVQAPVALSGFAIAYAIDDRHGHILTSLKLTPRLLAKLLTESYPSNPSIQSEYTALGGNPTDLGTDPEFQALNPGTTSFYANEPASTLLALSSDSDVMWALTAYIDADPEARAFLDGKPDPWGMVVNPSYKGIALPTASWPLLDSFVPTKLYATGANACLDNSTVPWLPLVASPVSAMATITLDLQFDVANSQINCLNGGQPNQKLAAVGREATGQRFVLGVTSLGDAERYALPTAELETQTAADAPLKFTDGTGRTFVAASNDGLKAAAAMLVADRTANTWLLPYDKLRSDAAGAQAYPGTMLVSMDVPTSGLPAAEASHYAAMLRFFSGPGQTPGFGNGQLPPGFLPMNAGNGLGALAAFSARAATAVTAQHGDLPLVTGGQIAGPVTTQPSGGSPGPTGGSSTPSTTPSATPSGTPSATPTPSVVALAPVGRTTGIGTGVGGLALPLVLLLALLGAVAAPVTRLVARLRASR
jgi:hypothetical protein